MERFWRREGSQEGKEIERSKGESSSGKRALTRELYNLPPRGGEGTALVSITQRRKGLDNTIRSMQDISKRSVDIEYKRILSWHEEREQDDLRQWLKDRQLSAIEALRSEHSEQCDSLRQEYAYESRRSPDSESILDNGQKVANDTGSAQTAEWKELVQWQKWERQTCDELLQLQDNADTAYSRAKGVINSWKRQEALIPGEKLVSKHRGDADELYEWNGEDIGALRSDYSTIISTHDSSVKNRLENEIQRKSSAQTIAWQELIQAQEGERQTYTSIAELRYLPDTEGGESLTIGSWQREVPEDTQRAEIARKQKEDIGTLHDHQYREVITFLNEYVDKLSMYRNDPREKARIHDKRDAISRGQTRERTTLAQKQAQERQNYDASSHEEVPQPEASSGASGS